MTTAKVVLYRCKKKKNNTSPLVLRMTKNRKPKYIFLGVDLKEEEWNEAESRVRKNHPNSKRINNLIINKLAEADDILIEAEVQKRDISTTQVKKQLKQTNKDVGFFQFAEECIENLRNEGKFKRAISDVSRIKNLKSFLNSDHVYFQDITVPVLEKFKIYLSTQRGIGNRTIIDHLILIRALFNKAIKSGIIDNRNYPFGPDGIKIRIPQTIKIGLEEKEIKAIEGLELEPGSPISHTRNVWLFSFYFAGIRISDVLSMKWRDFANDRLYYTMSKNSKPISIKVPEKVKEIISYYEKEKRSESDYIFPDLKNANQEDKRDLYIKNHTACRRLNKYLKMIAKMAGIEKTLSNHIARHSFGNIAGEKISPQMLQKLYRHSDIKTTMGYQANFIHKEADDALDAVINF